MTQSSPIRIATALHLGGGDPTIEPELKEFIDNCLVPILVRNALKEIQDAKSGAGLESTPSLHVHFANGDMR
jgi:hypothetical protein